MTAKQIIKSLDWEDIFGNSSQYENLYYFLKRRATIKEFTNGFYPKSKNKKIIKDNFQPGHLSYFIKHSKKIWNKAKIQSFCNGDEMDKVNNYIQNL